MSAALVLDLIVRRAAERPDAAAVVTEAATLSYRELIERATRVAGAVRLTGAGRDRVVGLTGARGLDGLVALLGILFAGAAYVYLDPAWPTERLRYAARQCGVRLVVGPGPAASAVAGPGQATLDSTAETGPGPRWVGGARPHDLCYVVYTSGSTGTPKGVAIEHGGVANMARQLAAVLPVAPGARMLQFAAWSWDAAVCEILVALTAGAALVIAPERVRHGGEPLAAFLRAQRVGVATLTPSLLAALSPDELPDLHTVAAVGEACPAELVARWAGSRRFLNGYGPTEATVAVSVGQCRPGERVSIGHPLRGVTVRVVDPAGRPVPAGQPGELLVGGAGLARGYLGEPTADGAPTIAPSPAFLVDGDGARWYRTGDVVRRDTGGALFYLGRRDDQVQLHGHRVELGEVASAVGRHPAVRAATAVVAGGRLVAYAVAADPALEPATVRDEAATWLPAHMVPEVRLVERLPLTAHGKLDRPALAAEGPPRQRPQGTDVLAQVLERIRTVLETTELGPEDDFFDAGGHSLLAAQLAVDLGSRFGVPVTAAQVTTHRTAASLASLVAPA